MRLWLALLSLLLLPSCSFLGLDVLPIEECSVDGDCDGLERIEPPADDCHTWQCDRSTRRCAIDVLDRDGDDVPVMLSPTLASCATGAMVDCNDDPADAAASTTFPGASEVCNGLDNDCDGLIDEGAPGLGETCTADEESTELLVGVARPSEIAIAEVLVRTTSGLRHITLPATGDPVEGSVTAVPALRAGTDSLYGLAYVRPGEWAILRNAGGTCTSPFVQRYTVSTARIEGARGVLPVPAGDACDGTGAPGALAITQRGALASDLAGDGEGLVSYLEGGELSECVGATVTSRPLEVFAATASFPVGSDYTVDPTPISLGQTVSSEAPALIAVADDTYLVALARADRTIEVLSIDAAGPTPTSTMVYREAATDLVPNLVSLARGAGGQYALTWAFVCPGGVRARLFDWAPGSTAVAGALISDESTTSRLPTALYQPALDEWLLTYSASGEARARRFDVEGSPIGEAFDVATEHRNELVVGQALDLDHAYRLFTLRDPAATPPTDVPVCPAILTMGCLPPS